MISPPGRPGAPPGIPPTTPGEPGGENHMRRPHQERGGDTTVKAHSPRYCTTKACQGSGVRAGVRYCPKPRETHQTHNLLTLQRRSR